MMGHHQQRDSRCHQVDGWCHQVDGWCHQLAKDYISLYTFVRFRMISCGGMEVGSVQTLDPSKMQIKMERDLYLPAAIKKL